MMAPPYDPVGALGGVFAPAYIVNDPVSKAAVDAWNAAHMKFPPGADPNTIAQQQQSAAMGSLFAPPFIASDPTSAADVTAWQTAQPPQAVGSSGAPPLAVAGSGYTPKYLPGGGLDPNDPGNIMQYYRLMGMGGAVAQMPVSGVRGAGGGDQQPMSGGAYSGGGPVAPGLVPPQVLLGTS